ncbi:MAG: S-layer homology domain-containing protein [Clostridia bacterium]|nr:S-layer homology domain-containing protein [Clostridia bacterium]
MKNNKRILSLLLTLLMTIGMVSVTVSPAMAVPTGNTVIFVKTGADGTGATPESPMGSFVSANQKLANAGGGTMVLVGPTEITSNTDFGLGDDYAANILFTSVYDGVDYRETADAALIFASSWKNAEVHCCLEFENITFITKGNYCSFYANGFPLVFGKGITCKTEGVDAAIPTNYLGIYGGSANDLSGTKNFPANTSVTVLSGTFYDIKGGGKGSADKPRPSLSSTITLGKDVKVMGAVAFDFNDNGKVEGEKVLIKYDGTNEKSPEGATRTHEITGNGYVRGGSEPGTFYIQAQKGYAARIDGELVKNGEYINDAKTVKFAFEESDLNKAEELAALRPTFSAGFPGEYIKGYDNGDGSFSFRPAGNITIAEASTIVVRLLTTEDKIKGRYTTERAKAEDWFYDNIAYLDSFETFEAFDNFDGNRQITRAEFVQLISTFKKLSPKSDEIKFTDVPADHKYSEAIKNATRAKLVNGYDNGDGTFSFKPDASITRAEVVTVINRVFDMADIAVIKYKDFESKFTDVDLEHWAVYQIIAAAGGKEIDKSGQLVGSGEVEHEAFGEVVFIKDGGTGDGSSAENAASYMQGHRMIKDTGTLVVCGPVVMNSNFDFTLGNTGKVLITSVYDGVDYRETAEAAIIFGSSWKNGVPRSETIFDNIAFVSRGSNCSIYCDNQKVTFGKDIVCVIEDAGAAISVYAGSANDLSSCVNYIDSTSTHVSHNGNYFGNLTINSGVWANVTGTGNGSEGKPRENNGSVVSISGNAKIGSVACGTNDKVGRLINGLRTVIFNNVKDVIADEASYDIFVSVTGAAYAEAVDVKKDSITIKVTADNGSVVEGVAEDGTITLTEAGGLVVTEKDGKVTVAKTGTEGAAGSEEDRAEFVTAEYLKSIDDMEAKRIAEIKATKSDIKPKDGRVAYYVSSSEGDDSNDGKSPEKAWKTIKKVQSASLLSGDVVYFKRGDTWRGEQLPTKPGVSYSAYGEGEKPVISMSPFDGAKHGTWTLVEGYTNIYKYSETFQNDIGSIAFNERTYRDIFAQKMCYDYNGGKAYRREAPNTVIEDILADMKNDLDFWHDCGGPNVQAPSGKGQLYLRSDKGNPAERFTNIEFNPRISAITGANNVTIDNITVRHAGIHGVSCGTVSNLKVQNCVFEWIGGSMQHYSNASGKSHSFTRLGNAVEVYGGCDGYTVDNCYIKDVYDAGVTHQVSDSSAGDYVMKNVTYSNNVILNCIYSIEHFNRQPASGNTTRYLVNILYKDNLCRFAGNCFGMTRPDKSVAAHIRSGGIVETANFVIEGNIFDRSEVSLFTLKAGGDQEIQWKNNTYIQKLGGKYGTINSVSKIYNSQIAFEVSTGFKNAEVGGTYLFVK